MTDGQKIMQRVDMLLAKEGLRGADLSRATGISAGSLTDWRKGRTSPKLPLLQRLASYFGVSVDELTGEPAAPAEKRMTYSSMVLAEAMDDRPALKTLCSAAQVLDDDKIAILVKLAQMFAPKEG